MGCILEHCWWVWSLHPFPLQCPDVSYLLALNTKMYIHQISSIYWHYWYGDGDSAWSQDTLFVIWAIVETPGHNAVTINWWLNNMPPPYYCHQQEGPFGYYWDNGRAGYIWCDHVSDGASSSLSLSHVTRAGQMALLSLLWQVTGQIRDKLHDLITTLSPVNCCNAPIWRGKVIKTFNYLGQ